MIHLIWVTIAVCLIAFLYLKWLNYKSYWADRGVPHIPPVPLLGNITFFKRENIGHWLRRLYRQFDSPYVGIWVFLRPGIVVNSPEIARNILHKDFDIFKNRYLSSDKSDPIGSLNLLTVDDPFWSTMRRHLGSMFTSYKLRHFQGNTRAKANELIQKIRNLPDTKINIKQIFLDYTTDVIGTFAFGVKSDVTLTATGPLKNVAVDFAKYDFYRNVAWWSIFFFPQLVKFFRFKFFPKQSTAYFKKIYRTVVAQRERMKRNNDVKDLIDHLIDFQKENKSISEDTLVAQAAVIFLGGFDSSANLLAYVVYELAYHPDVQERVYQELSEAKQRHGNDQFDMSIFSELHHLDSVIKETLRMFPPMGWIDRVALQDYKVDEKLTIEAGTVVYINCFGMHFDPKYFPEPDKFYPDRFLPENKSQIEAYSYLPFGEGPRACIGKRFGVLTAQFALSQILLNYKIQPCPDAPKPSEVKISSQTVWYMPASPLYVKLIPRS